MIITRTPFRISFFGGGTDYPQWFREHGGAVLATAIDKYCYINCRYLPPFFQHRSRVIYHQIENVSRNEDIAHPAVRACLAALGIVEGVEIHHDADLPARTGLGTSSSFVVGLLNALRAMRREACAPAELARAAIEIEQVRLAENVGVQDQIIAALGGFQLLRFRSSGEFQAEALRLPQERMLELQASLHLYFTGYSRTASQIARQQLQQMPRHIAEMHDLAAMAEAGAAVLQMASGGVEEFGRLLAQGWALKRRLSEQISNSSIDGLYEQGRSAGAIGGKLLGAGGGGFLLFCVPAERSRAFREAMRPLLRVPFTLGAPGSSVVVSQPEDPYDQDLDAARLFAYAQSA